MAPKPSRRYSIYGKVRKYDTFYKTMCVWWIDYIFFIAFGKPKDGFEVNIMYFNFRKKSQWYILQLLCWIHFSLQNEMGKIAFEVMQALFRVWALQLSSVTSLFLQYPPFHESVYTGPVYTGMALEYHWFTQCSLWYHCVTQRIPVGYTVTPLENLVETVPHWYVTGETLTIAAYTGTPLEGQ